MTTSHFLLSSVVVLALAAPLPAGVPIPPDVKEHATKLVEQGRAMGIVVALVSEEGTTYFAHGRPSGAGGTLSERTIFEIGSITKVFTSALLADMQLRGRVTLGAPVAELLPDGAKVPSNGGKKITLESLATQHSGLPRLPDGFSPGDVTDPYVDYGGDDLLELLAHHELTREPGESYEYSNLGVGLLGFALARREGSSYEDAVVRRLCEPLGMRDTRMTLSDEQRSRLAKGHVGTREVPGWQFDALAGAGALRSTAADMAAFLAANLGLVEKGPVAALRLTHARRAGTDTPGVSIALGWHILEKEGTSIVWHNGGTGGYRTFCAFRPDTRRGVVVLCNSFEDSVDAIGFHLLEPALPLPPLSDVVAVDGAKLQELAGHYELAPGTVFEVTREGGHLHAMLTGQAAYPVYPESATTFAYRGVDAKLEFLRGADGKVDRLVLHQNGEHVARRIEGYQPPVHVEVAVAPEVLQRYVGRYELAAIGVLDVQLAEGQLQVKLGSQPRLPVFPESETRFYYKAVEAQIVFVVDGERGEVTGLVLHQSGQQMAATKID